MVSASGSRKDSKAAATVPQKMKGILRPHLVFVLSDNDPNSGSINTASTLSSAMITPETASFTSKVCFRINGTIPS